MLMDVTKKAQRGRVCMGSEQELDQILAEIEKLGYKYTLISQNMNGANEDYLCWVVKWAIPTAKRGLYGVTPTDAAAEALLWIKQQGGIKDCAHCMKL